MPTASFLAKVKKLGDMPADVALKKIWRKGFDRLYFFFRKYRLLVFPTKAVSIQLEGFHTRSRYLFNPQQQAEYVEMMRTLNCEQDIIEQAELICSHYFNLLGSSLTYLGERLPWNEDFKTNHRWENRFYKEISIIDLSNAADVKVPWELSRFQHFFTLGKAYWLTGNEKYALEFKAQVEDWIIQNPVEMSVNWTCAMDVAIRAVNWIAAYHFFSESPSLHEAFWRRFNQTLFMHGKYIIRNLENGGDHTGNHYLSNLAGLISLGLFFRDGPKGRHAWGKDAEVWLTYGTREIEREMFVQMHEDGSNYEASTSYHRLVTECFLVVTLLCQRNDLLFSDRYMHRLEKMCECIMHTMKPDGRTPLIGDADDGRLLIVSRYGKWIKNDFRHILSVAGELFDRDDFRVIGRDFSEEALWMTGKPPKQTLPKSIPLTSCSYPDGGYFILRNEEAYCLVRCGELSFHGQGTHSHNDQLSFELQVNREDIFIDPGCYVYTADYRMRNYFRGTKSHNTIQINGKEQNDFEELQLFEMREETFSQCVAFQENYFKGMHHGYVNKCGLVHCRELTLRPGEFEIQDRLEPAPSSVQQAADVNYCSTYILPPSMNILERTDKCIIYNENISVELVWDEFSQAQIDECWVSESYGVRVPSKAIRIFSSQFQMKTWIRWHVV
ncbi:hypothetical protein J2TS6_12810 [Paenibacillus albilobatus]|uniref:Heparin-sulfate lyase N-terminal domain-containing protein n=2 Tax=Paenibacillus TaxID=44249 RepID=A0A919XGJ7_9BACL|nr:hypothetical protein J2TS6_12810 [Paenibacillus albilobatus]